MTEINKPVGSYANKYRPQSLRDLVGQDLIRDTLINAISHNRIKQAFLFSGLHGTGKTSTARILAKSLNCSRSDTPTVDPCGICENCRAISLTTALDVIEIDIAADPSVDRVRELIENCYTNPIKGRYKLYILDECHQWSKQAQNAFLRCLETPPKHVIFILATTESHKLLSTIKSRCLEFPFRRINNDSIMTRLKEVATAENLTISDGALKKITLLSGGSLRDSLSLLDRIALHSTDINVDLVEQLSGVIPEAIFLEIAEDIKADDLASVLIKGNELLAQGNDPNSIILGLLFLFTDFLKLKTSSKAELLVRITNIERAKKLIIDWDSFNIARALNYLSEAQKQLQNHKSPDIWLEVSLLNLMIALGAV